MKIDIVTFSCNDSPIYYEFWNPISKYWKEKMGMHPVLLYCGDIDLDLSEEHGDVFRFDSRDDIPGYVAGCWGRFWLTQKYPDKVCMTGDIDMIPLNKSYFTDDLERYDRLDYVHLNADGYYHNNFDHWKTPYNSLTAYYHVATGKVFNDVYSFELDFYDEMKRYIETDYSGKTNYAFNPESHLKHASAENGGKWCQDEIWSTDLLRDYLKKGGSVRTEVGIRNARVDRARWSYNPKDVVDGKYIDSHLLRPYSQYKEHIDFLMDLVK